MPRSQRSLFVFYTGLLVGALVLLLFFQIRFQRTPQPAGSHSAFAPNGQSATPLPAAAASLRGGQTTIRSDRVAPDTPGSLNNLPPPPPHARFGEPAAEHEAEAHIESNLTEEEYEAAVAHARDLPPDPALAPGFGALATGPTLGTNFNGLDVADCCGNPGNFFTWPPDPDIAVGANHIVVGVNSAFAVYNKSGVKQGATVNAYSFWSTAGGVCGTIANDPNGSIFDPFVAYDPGADRFIVGFDAFSNDGSTRRSYVCIAISPVGDPTAAAGSWYRYSVNVKENVSGSDQWLDYPHIGVWYNGLYVTGNYFRFSDNAYLYSSIYALDKADMYAGLATDIRIVDDIRDAYDYPIFTLQPVKASYTYPSTGPVYFLNNDCLVISVPCDAAELNVYKLTVDFVGGGTSLALAENLSVATYAYPVSASQSGTTAKVQANDERLLDAQWHTNGTIYATHTGGCNPGGGTVDCVRWYQVGNLSGTPTLLQQGTISGSSQYRFFPDLAVDRSGNMAIAYSYSSSSDQVGIRFTGRQAGDSNGTTAADATFKAGEAVYSNTFASSPHRWGDYTAMAVDPVDGCTLWYVGEFSKTRVYSSGPNWGTRIGKLSFSSCAVLTLVLNPSTVMENALNPASIGTVSRGLADASPLIVNISSSLPLTVTVPATVTIPTSQTSTTFPITVVDDALPGTTFLNATLTVTATNYITGAATLTVLDDETVKQLFLSIVRR
jgi:hypothetical protein